MQYFEDFKKNLFFGKDDHQISNFIIMYFAFIKWLNEYQYTQFNARIKKNIQDQINSIISETSSKNKKEDEDQISKVNGQFSENKLDNGQINQEVQINQDYQIDQKNLNYDEINFKFNQQIGRS